MKPTVRWRRQFGNAVGDEWGLNLVSQGRELWLGVVCLRAGKFSPEWLAAIDSTVLRWIAARKRSGDWMTKFRVGDKVSVLGGEEYRNALGVGAVVSVSRTRVTVLWPSSGRPRPHAAKNLRLESDERKVNDGRV